MSRLGKFFVCAACLLASCVAGVCAESEAELLDVLVRRGVLTQQESLDVGKMAVASVESVKSFSRIRLFSFWHLRYQYFDHRYSNAQSLDKNNFAIRRIIPVLIADLTESSRVLLTLYLPSNSLINTARYEYNIDNGYLCGSLWIGYEAVFFCMEENESGMRIMTPDRSVINMYFGGGDHGFSDGYVNSHTTPAAFSGYHTGVFWNGKFVKNKSLIYRLAVTNSKPEGVKFDACNSMAFWASFGCDKADESGGYRLRAGVNGGYSMRVVSAAASAVYPSRVADYGDCFGVNPYLWLNYKNFTFQSEFVLTSMKYGKSRSNNYALYTVNSSRANPFGYYALIAYKLDARPFGEFEPVFRYSAINSDGRGLAENGILYKAENRGGIFNTVDCFYGGVNWYVLGNALKYQIGVEYARFRDGVVGDVSKSSDVVMFIAQMQMVF